MREKNFNSFQSKATVVCLTATVVLPFVWLTVQSFASGWRFPALLPSAFDWRAWNYALDSSAGVPAALFNSLLIALIVASLSIILALPAARAIALREFRGKNLILFSLILPIFSPSIASALGGHALFLRLGLTDSLAGVILAHLVPTVPYAVLTLIGGFSRLDVDFEAQARSLGASPRQILRFVTLPLIMPSLVVAAFFAFLISWSQYLPTLLIGGGRIITLPLILVNFQRGGDERVTAAITLIFLVPTVLFLIISTRYWREI